MCSVISVLKVLNLLRIIINVIKIVVPIMLIIFIMIDYTKAVSDTSLKRAHKNTISRLIAAALIFLVPTFIGLIIKVSNPSSESFVSCFKNATPENILKIATEQFDEYLAEANKSLSYNDLNAARTVLEYIEDDSIRKQKEALLDETDGYIKLMNEVKSLQSRYDSSKYNSVKSKINSVKNGSVKSLLSTEFNKIQIPKPTSIGGEGGQTQSGKSGSLTYYVNVPDNVTSGLPLVIFLHGDNGESWAPKSPVYNSATQYYGGNFPFIILAPAGGMWAETSGRLEEIHSIILKECEKYSCNKNKIVITGASRGAIGTWAIVSKYPGFFYSAVPVSCGGSVNPHNFIGTKVRAFAGTVGSDEQGYNSSMRSIVNSINNAGGNATFIELTGKSHMNTPQYAYTKDTLEWMIK